MATKRFFAALGLALGLATASPAQELQAMRAGTTGPITGFNYSNISRYLWYRHGTANGIPTIEMYGIHPGESDATLDTPPAGSGWIPYLNSDGEASAYISETSAFTSSSSNSIADKATSAGFYDTSVDPEMHMWWPIFETTITNAQGALANDYGY